MCVVMIIITVSTRQRRERESQLSLFRLLKYMIEEEH